MTNHFRELVQELIQKLKKNKVFYSKELTKKTKCSKMNTQ